MFIRAALLKMCGNACEYTTLENGQNQVHASSNDIFMSCYVIYCKEPCLEPVHEWFISELFV